MKILLTLLVLAVLCTSVGMCLGSLSKAVPQPVPRNIPYTVYARQIISIDREMRDVLVSYLDCEGKIQYVIGAGLNRPYKYETLNVLQDAFVFLPCVGMTK